MGGPGTLVIDGALDDSHRANVIGAIQAELKGLEARYSRFDPASLISAINACAGTGQLVPLDFESQKLFDFCDALWQESLGAFDPTSGALAEAWDFRTDGGCKPELVPTLLEKVGWSKVLRVGNAICLPTPGMGIDFGGIVKEYAVDCVAKIIIDANIQSAMIDLAGDIRVIGQQFNGQPWRIGVRDPANPEVSLLQLSLSDSAIATSGNYARAVVIDGIEYSHLLNPVTGWPVEGPRSVTVIGENCLTAGAIATVACLKAESSAEEWLVRSGMPWLMISSDGTQTGPIAEMLTRQQNEGHRESIHR